MGTTICHDMGWLRLVGSIKLYVFFAKEPYKRDDILQKKPMILSILPTEATPYLDDSAHLRMMRWCDSIVIFTYDVYYTYKNIRDDILTTLFIRM